METSSNISDDYLKKYYTESFKSAIKSNLKDLGYDIDEIFKTIQEESQFTFSTNSIY